MRRKYFTQRVFKVVLFVHNMHIFKIMVIPCHGGVVQGQRVHIHIRELKLGEHFCNFSAPVGAKVKRNNCIAFLNACVCNSAVDDGKNKFIRYSIFVTFLYSTYHIFLPCSCSFNHSIVRNFNAFPTLISIHGIIAPGYTCNAAGCCTHVRINIF